MRQFVRSFRCAACGAGHASQAAPVYPELCRPCASLAGQRDAQCLACLQPRLWQAEAKLGRVCQWCLHDELEVRCAIQALREATPRAVSAQCSNLTHTQVQAIVTRLFRRGEVRFGRSSNGPVLVVAE